MTAGLRSAAAAEHDCADGLVRLPAEGSCSAAESRAEPIAARCTRGRPVGPVAGVVKAVVDVVDCWWSAAWRKAAPAAEVVVVAAADDCCWKHAVAVAPPPPLGIDAALVRICLLAAPWSDPSCMSEARPAGRAESVGGCIRVGGCIMWSAPMPSATSGFFLATAGRGGC